MKYDLSKFEELVAQKYLRKCVKDDLTIYTYTEKTTYESYWNEYTNVARGLILNNKTGGVVAKPFPKFHNLGAHPTTYLDNLPMEGYTVTEKADGSLAILYYHNGKWNVATKGSFNSDQAKRAEEILKKYDLSSIESNLTLLAEIIYPENKIVVDYKDKEELVLLGCYNRETCEEIYDIANLSKITGFPIIQSYDYTIEEMIALQATLPKDQEGFVVRFDNGLRVKIKGKEYLKVHKIVTNMSPLSFWEVMKDGKVPLSYIQQIPEEFKDDFNSIIKALELQYEHTKWQIEEEFQTLPTKEQTPEARKTIGLHIKQYSYFHEPAMFPMLMDKKDVVDKYILKHIRPDGNSLNL